MSRHYNRQDKLIITDSLIIGPSARVQRQLPDGTHQDVQLGGALSAGAAETVDLARQLMAEDSGKTFYLQNAAGAAITLPPPDLGLNFRFVVSTAPAGGDYTIETEGGADIVKGAVQEAGAATGSASQAGDTVTLADGVAVIGDQVQLECDGVAWILTGSSAADNGIVISAT